MSEKKQIIIDSKFDEKNKELTIFTPVRVDSGNAPEIESTIDEIIAKYSDMSKLVFDFKDCEYISSAGLRIILRISKRSPNTKVINASAEVYEIFDLVGFTTMLSISKKAD